MKKQLLLFMMLPLMSFSQATRTSVQNGNASNPLTWDCTCFPAMTDHVVINHQVAMDVNWAITSGGSITVNAPGSLLQSGMHNILVDGASSQYINHGSSAFDNIAYMNGAYGSNSGSFSITTALYIGSGAGYNNIGLMDGLDSLMNEGTYTNSGTLYTGNFLNTGSFNNTGHIAADSTGNTGAFNSTGGYMSFTAFGNSGSFSMTTFGWMEVAENWFNVGDFTLGAGLQIYAHNDFFNLDSLGGQANLINNGTIEVANNFYNSYVIDGTGNFCIGNYSYNSGAIYGTLDICDNTGQDFDFNVGAIDPQITFCLPGVGCYVGIDPLDEVTLSMYPNPSEGSVIIESNQEINHIRVFAISGELLKEISYTGEKLSLTSLNSGTYFLQVLGPLLNTTLPLVIY